MTLPDAQSRTWQNLSATRWRRQFRRALVLSVAAHLLLLAFFSVIVAVIMTSDSGSPPRDLKFVFTPSEEEENELVKIVEDDSEKSNNSPQLAPKAPRKKNSSPHPKQRATTGLTTASQHSPPSIQDPRDIPEVSPSPFAEDLPIDLDESPVKNAAEFAPVFRARGNVKEYFDENYQMATATLPVAPREIEAIDAKIEQLIDDLTHLEQKDTTIFWRQDETDYTIKIDHQPAAGAMDFDELSVKISREDDGVVFTTEKRMRRTAFSHYAKFVDYWNPRIVLHDDEFDGRFHSNSTFNIMNIGRRPKFRGKVTTAAYKIKTSGTPYSSFIAQKDSVFIKGLETGTHEISLPKKLGIQPADKMDSLAISFYDETWLNFKPNGFLVWRTKISRGKQKIRLPKQAFTISGFDQGKLHIRGIVAGKVLIYSTSDILIDGSLVCKTDPRLFADSPDYLGVVSEKDIVIADPKTTGPGDLNLFGAYFCKKRFRVRKFWHENNGAKLNIFGSITAGTVGATEPRYGTRVKFDKRLQKKRPPFFPMTDQFEIIEWDGKWHSQSGN